MIETKGLLKIVRGGIFERTIQFREADGYTNTDLTGRAIVFKLPMADGTKLEKELDLISPAQLGNATIALSEIDTISLQEGCEQTIIVVETKDSKDTIYTIPVDIVDAD